MGSVDYLPICKEGATPEERLAEVMNAARRDPDRFAKMLIVYAEDTPTHCTTRYACHGCTTMELLGLLELAKMEIHTVTRHKKEIP